jgi:hypothetical protein
MLAGTALLALAWRLGGALPPPQELQAALAREPLQEPVAMAPFTVRVGEVDYTVKPLFRYEIAGLVVSRHDTSTWWNWIARATHDRLNVADLCVVFAENVARGGYAGIEFSSGQFVCHAHTRSRERWAAFSMRALSNNHLLTDRADLARRLRAVRAGDQMRIRGYLAEYAHGYRGGFSRGTSTTRDDTGNGACETIFVEDFEVLAQRTGAMPLGWAGVTLLAAGVVGWVRRPFRPFDP